MAQKFFEPFRKIPQQLQNLNLIQKLQGLTIGRSAEAFSSLLASTYGCLESPSAIAFDDKLSLLAVGSRNGAIKVYGIPGVVLNVRSSGAGVLQLCFLPEEGRLVVACADGALSLYELDPRNGGWSECSRVQISNSEKEQITSMVLGHGLIYVGSSTGVLYQVAVNKGRLFLGDSTLTALTSAMLLEGVPVDKRNDLGVDSPIVSLECQPDGALLLVAYAGGCVAVVVPQPVPELNGTDRTQPDVPETCEQEPAVNGTCAPTEVPETPQAEPAAESADASATTEPVTNTDTAPQRAPETPVKGEKKTTLKLKELTRSLKRFELGKPEPEVEPPLPVPPPPRVSHVLVRDQPVEWATWRVHAVGVPPKEVTVAYGDGAFQVWPITTSVPENGVSEAILVSRRDPPNTPYGPLPCGAIKKIAQYPGVTTNMLTIFSGGLPRAEFQDRHAVSVLQDSEHHVCFQFGSKVVDFVLLPSRAGCVENGNDLTEDHITRPSAPKNASALLVLTERELVAVDLEQPNWPTFASPYLNCLDLSPVTAVTHLTKVSSTLLSRLRDSAWYDSTEITHNQWPITGGGNCSDGVDLSHNDCNDVVILGHANGWVTLLGIGRGDSMHRLGAFHTDVLFNLADASKCHSGMEVETWPPFRRVGDCALTEPFCQHPTDPRLAVTQLVASATADSITLIVGGAAGQLSVWTASEQQNASAVSFEPDVSRITVNLMELDPGKSAWDGLSALKPFEGIAQCYGNAGPTFHPCALIQFEPPAPITSVALESSWNLLAVGCSCGFALIDMLTKAAIWMELIPPHPVEQQHSARKGQRAMNVASVQTAFANRRRQVTAQLRQSFRRLKHLRTSTTTSTTNEATTPENPDAEAAPVVEPTASGDQPEQAQTKPQSETTPGPSEPMGGPQPDPSEKATGEEAAETTTSETSAAAAIEPTPPEPIRLSPEDPSAVRCLMFADTYVISPVPATAQQPAIPSPRTPCLWVGTNSGRVLAYGLNWDQSSGPVTVQLHKELQLQHRAPVIGMCVLDAHTRSPMMATSRTRTGSVVEEKAPEVTESTDTQKEGEQQPAEAASATAEAQSAAQVPPDSHQLLLCSDEQVKIFQLPSLRALHKCKFIDRPRLHTHLGGLGSSLMASNSVGSETAATKHEKESTVEKDEAEPKPAAVANEVDTKSSQTMSQQNRKSIRAFGVQAFTRPNASTASGSDQGKTEWNVVVARQDGRMFILSLPHLRKMFKIKPVSDATMHCIPCVASLSDANYVFWQSACQLTAYELCPNPHLLSPALVVPGSHAAPLAAIGLPEWARPQPPPSVAEEAAKADQEAVVATGGPDTTEVPLIDDSGESVGHIVNGATEVQAVEPTELVHPLPEKYNPTAALHAGDVTIDSIKEYLNGDGTVTIKTIETSTEKRTLVEGGHVVTTVRETECVDGQVTKDDVLKFSTDDSASPQPIVETS